MSSSSPLLLASDASVHRVAPPPASAASGLRGLLSSTAVGMMVAAGQGGRERLAPLPSLMTAVGGLGCRLLLLAGLGGGEQLLVQVPAEGLVAALGEGGRCGHAPCPSTAAAGALSGSVHLHRTVHCHAVGGPCSLVLEFRRVLPLDGVGLLRL